MSQSNILFLIPDSTGIRNYLYSDVLSILKDKVNLFFWSTLPIEAFQEVKTLHQIQFDFKQIKLPTEGLPTRLLRESATFARLNWIAKKVQNETILTNWNFKPKSLKTKLLLKLAQAIGKHCSSKYKSILLLEALARKNWNRKVIEYYINELQAQKITKIVITHQRVSNLMPLCLAAMELNIEVITVIYSWDNLPKARLNVVADKYLVWSDYMKQEMKIYYPEIPEEKVIVTGTPQFEFYSNLKLVVRRKTFAQQYGLDETKNWILYSGGDLLTSPYDQVYLYDLVSSLEEEQNIQIIFRRSPADFSNRFDDVLQKFKVNLVSIDPICKVGNHWSKNISSKDDLSLLSSLAHHCVLAINVGSTIAHDFANVDKPSIYINYELDSIKDWSIHVINSFQHFRSMPSKDAVVWVNNRHEWLNTILRIIDNPSDYAKDRLIWYRIINNAGLHDKKPSNVISNLLLN